MSGSFSPPSEVNQRGREKKGPPDVPKILLLKGAKMVLCPFHRSHREIWTRNRPVSETKFLDDFWGPLSLPAPLVYCCYFIVDCKNFRGDGSLFVALIGPFTIPFLKPHKDPPKKSMWAHFCPLTHEVTHINSSLGAQNGVFSRTSHCLFS